MINRPIRKCIPLSCTFRAPCAAYLQKAQHSASLPRCFFKLFEAVPCMIPQILSSGARGCPRYGASTTSVPDINRHENRLEIYSHSTSGDRKETMLARTVSARKGHSIDLGSSPPPWTVAKHNVIIQQSAESTIYQLPLLLFSEECS